MPEQRRTFPSELSRLPELRGFFSNVCRAAWGPESDHVLHRRFAGEEVRTVVERPDARPLAASLEEVSKRVAALLKR